MTNKCKFTVFTSTYNRAYSLGGVYESLKKQSFKDFEWIIIDDGSADNTRDLVNSWIKENLFSIRYIWQKNSGKHVAINNGVKNALGELFLIIDSDDICLPESLEKFNFYWEMIPDDQKYQYAGLFFNCKDKNQTLIGTLFPEKIFDSNMIDIYYKNNVKGDKWGFFRTDILKNYPFPEIKDENFLSEATVWNRISLKYKIRFVNEEMLIVDYRKDGLSNNSFKFRKLNPKGACLYYREFLTLPVSLFWKLRAFLNYIRFGVYLFIKNL